MNNNDKASISIRKIVCISIVLIFLLGIGVMAGNVKVNNVKIVLSSGYEMNILTTKTNIKEILEENHIILLEDEKVTPAQDEELSDNKTIIISKKDENLIEVTEAENSSNVTTEQLLENYSTIVEKIVVEKVKIPYETIKKDVSTGSGTKQNKVVQNGVDGLKEVTYKVKYQNDKEIERIEISSKVIKKAVNKVIEIRTKQITTRSGSTLVTASTNPAATSTASLAKKVEGITPKVSTFNTSAYCACRSCCGKTNGITASGAKASQWCTIAAGSCYPMGTVIYIPYFKNKPNGGWFVVQDRGGAISSNRIDVFMGSHSQALQFGRRNLTCYVYQF